MDINTVLAISFIVYVIIVVLMDKDFFEDFATNVLLYSIGFLILVSTVVVIGVICALVLSYLSFSVDFLPSFWH